MSRSNYDKPFYVDVGTSVVAIRCASNHDVVFERDHTKSPYAIELMEDACDRMNKEFELYAQSKMADTKPKCNWSVKDALAFANTLANHGWTRKANADAASSCIYALCRMRKDGGNAAEMHVALIKALTALKVCEWPDGTDMDGVKSIISEIESTLSAPPRNCDVGTAQEQAERFVKHCSKFPKCMKCPCCGKIRYNSCEFVWAQMPYEADASFTKTGENVNSGSAVDMEVNKPENRRAQ